MAVVVAACAAYAVSWSADRPTASVASEPVSDGPSLSPTVPSQGASSDDRGPGGSELALGETFTGSRASSTVERVAVLSAPPGLAAPDGDAWFGFYVTRCAGETTSSVTAPWSRWVVANARGAVYPGDDSVPDGIVARRLTTRGFPAGECRAGWVIISVPKGVASFIESVRLVPPAGASAEWRVQS